MTIFSQGGKISLTDPNDNLNNTIDVVADVSEDEREQIFREVGCC